MGALIEGMYIDAGPDERRNDIGLQIGEGENEVGLKRENLGNVSGCEC
jgi:hypothetical protein